MDVLSNTRSRQNAAVSRLLGRLHGNACGRYYLVVALLRDMQAREPAEAGPEYKVTLLAEFQVLSRRTCPAIVSSVKSLALPAANTRF